MTNTHLPSPSKHLCSSATVTRIPKRDSKYMVSPCISYHVIHLYPESGTFPRDELPPPGGTLALEIGRSHPRLAVAGGEVPVLPRARGPQAFPITFSTPQTGNHLPPKNGDEFWEENQQSRTNKGTQKIEGAPICYLLLKVCMP